MRRSRSSASRWRRHRFSATSSPPRCRPRVLGVGERVVADDHPQEAEQDVAVADRQAAAADHPELVVARHVDEVARPLEPEPVEPRHHVRRRLAGQDRRAAHGVGLVGLDAVREQPPAPVLDRDRPPDLGLEVVDDLLQVRHGPEPYDARRWTSWSSARGSAGSPPPTSSSAAARRCACWRRSGVGAEQSAGLARIFRIAHADAAAVRAGAGGARALARVGARAGRGPAAGRRGPRGGRRRAHGAR